MPDFEYSFLTDIGRKRSQNQDNGLPVPELGLFVVADGMGGHQGGETASALAVDAVRRSLQQARRTKKFDPRKALARAIRDANDEIYTLAQKEPHLSGMGTTCTALLFEGDSVFIGQVGDSRCYLIRPGNIFQLTRDHSLVQEKLRAGIITREQVKRDAFRNVITRSVGFEPSVNVDVYEMPLHGEDLFLICSDGLSGPVDDKMLLETVTSRYLSQPSEEGLKAVTRQLVNLANEAGGDDNVTVIVARKKV